MVFGVGGEKIQSSSMLVNKFVNYREDRQWGYFENLIEEKTYKVKKLIIYPGQKISFQFHNYRNEKWFAVKGKGLVYIEDEKLKCKKGSFFEIRKGQTHSLENIGKLNLEIIEIQLGKKVVEEDIVRLKDIYGRV